MIQWTEGPEFKMLTNLCHGDFLVGEEFSEGHFMRHSNSQGGHRTLHELVWGELVGQDYGLTFTFNSMHHENRLFYNELYPDIADRCDHMVAFRCVNMSGVQPLLKHAA